MTFRRHEANDTNVSMGMVPCKPNCRCDDCRIDRLQAEVNNLRTLLHDHIIAADQAQAEARTLRNLGVTNAETIERLTDALQHITDYPAGAMSLTEIRAIADAALCK